MKYAATANSLPATVSPPFRCHVAGGDYLVCHSDGDSVDVAVIVLDPAADRF